MAGYFLGGDVAFFGFSSWQEDGDRPSTAPAAREACRDQGRRYLVYK